MKQITVLKLRGLGFTIHIPREESIVWVQNKALYHCPLGDRRGQPAWRNLPAGNTPPPAVDTQTEVLALLGQSSRGAVPSVHWYHGRRKTQMGCCKNVRKEVKDGRCEMIQWVR